MCRIYLPITVVSACYFNTSKESPQGLNLNSVPVKLLPAPFLKPFKLFTRNGVRTIDNWMPLSDLAQLIQSTNGGHHCDTASMQRCLDAGIFSVVYCWPAINMVEAYFIDFTPTSMDAAEDNLLRRWTWRLYFSAVGATKKPNWVTHQSSSNSAEATVNDGRRHAAVIDEHAVYKSQEMSPFNHTTRFYTLRDVHARWFKKCSITFNVIIELHNA